MEIIQTRDPEVQAYSDGYSVVAYLLKQCKNFGDIDQAQARVIFETIIQALDKRERNDSVKIRINDQDKRVGQNNGKVLIVCFFPSRHANRLQKAASELIDEFGEENTLKFTHFVEALTKNARSLYFDIVFMVENPLFDPSIYLKILIFSFYYWRLYSTLGEEWTPDVLRGIGEFFDLLKSITLEGVEGESDRFDLFQYLFDLREDKASGAGSSCQSYRSLGELSQAVSLFWPRRENRKKA